MQAHAHSLKNCMPNKTSYLFWRSFVVWQSYSSWLYLDINLRTSSIESVTVYLHRILTSSDLVHSKPEVLCPWCWQMLALGVCRHHSTWGRANCEVIRYICTIQAREIFKWFDIVRALFTLSAPALEFQCGRYTILSEI